MENKQFGANLPSGTWESVWINLIIRATSEWRDGNYIGSWNTTQELYSWLPQECKAETKKQIEAIREKLKTFYSNDPVYHRRVIAQNNMKANYLYAALLEVHEAIEKSLETHGWICKTSGASPQIQHSKEARF